MSVTELERAERIRRALDALLARIAKAIVGELRKQQRGAPEHTESAAKPAQEG